MLDLKTRARFRWSKVCHAHVRETQIQSETTVFELFGDTKAIIGRVFMKVVKDFLVTTQLQKLAA
jgi:hypothetical protein